MGGGEVAMWAIQLYSPHTHTCTHSQSGLTALKVAQSEGHQDVCDILIQYSQQGSKVITPKQAEERKAEVGMMTLCTIIVNLSTSLLFRGKKRVI